MSTFAVVTPVCGTPLNQHAAEVEIFPENTIDETADDTSVALAQAMLQVRSAGYAELVLEYNVRFETR